MTEPTPPVIPVEDIVPFEQAGRQALEESLQSVLRLVAGVSALFGYLVTLSLVIAYDLNPQWSLYAGPVVILMGGTLVFLSKSSYRYRASALIFSLLLGAYLAERASGNPVIQLSYLLIMIVSGVLLGPYVALLTAGLSTLLMTLGDWSDPTGRLSVAHLAALWLTAGVLSITIGKLYHAIREAEIGQIRAWQAVQEARLRRGELHSVVHSLEEATYRIERMNNELYLAKREADEARSLKVKFATTVSHEIRGPLNLILGYSRMMALFPERYGAPLPPNYRQDIETVYRSSQHLLSLVDDILDLGQMEAQRLPLVKDQVYLAEDVVDKVFHIVQPLAERKGLALRKEIVADLPWILADPIRLRQALLNLLINAVRVTEKGHITVSAEAYDESVRVSVEEYRTRHSRETASPIVQRVSAATDQHPHRGQRKRPGTEHL